MADASGARARAMGMLRPFADAVVQVLIVGSGNSVKIKNQSFIIQFKINTTTPTYNIGKIILSLFRLLPLILYFTTKTKKIKVDISI